MVELFSDIFTYRDNVLLHTDVRCKLLVALAGIAAVMLAHGPLLPLIVCALCLIALFLLAIPLRLIVFRLAAPLGMALMLLIVKTFLTGTVPLFTFPLLSLQLTATADGFAAGLLLSARVLGAVSLVILLGCVTPAYRIFQALRWLRMPAEWLDVAALVYRYIFVLLDRAVDLAAAQRLRLGFSGLRRSLNTAGILAGATLLHSLEQATRVHEAMRLRCSQGTMRFETLPRLTARDGVVASLSLFLILTAYLLTEGVLRP